MTAGEAKEILKDLATEIRRLSKVPVSKLPEDARWRLTTARNMLRAIGGE